MKTLRLTLKKKWFDMILSGEKKEEYREIKQYWSSRLLWHGYHQDVDSFNSLREADELASEDLPYVGIFRKDLKFVEFTNGYHKNARKMTVELEEITCGDAVSEWSDNWAGKVFVLKLGEIISRP